MSPHHDVLRMAGITRSFPTTDGRVEVLRGVNLTVRRGDFVMISGPSGSGKSTLLNLAALLDKPSTGTIHFNGIPVSTAAESELCDLRKREVGMVFQKFCLLPHRSALDNVLFRFRYMPEIPATAQARALAILDEMGLAGISHRCARLLSAGEMQRVAIARAVVQQPSLLVADEPTGNLDIHSAETVMACFTRLNRQGLPIVMVTHNLDLLKYSTVQKVCREGALE